MKTIPPTPRPASRVVAVLVAVVLVCSTGDALPRGAGGSRWVRERRPAMMIWAWERPESLRFIDPAAVGVAYLDRTIEVREGRLAVRPRQQKLLVPPGTALVSVVRLESRDETLAPETLRTLAEEIAKAAARPGVQGVQVDFDATASQRASYARLLAAVRSRLPADMGLGMTALASWCGDSAWLAAIDVDEVIPMLFRLGADRDALLRRLAAGEPLVSPRCREGLGVSTDEPLPRTPAHVRLYVFHPRAWTADAVGEARSLFGP